MMIAIRRAGPEDAAVLAAVAEQGFVETFGASYPPEDLRAFLAQAYTVASQERLLRDPAHAVWLLEEDGVAIGHVLAGPCGLPHPAATAADGEIKRLYVLARAHNGGWGTRLLELSLEWLLSEGPRTLWVGVWSENYGAQRLYARYGFQKAGEYEFVVGATRDREFIFRRRIDAPTQDAD